MEIRRTKKGWVGEYTGYSAYYHALIAGAIRGRRVWLSYAAEPGLARYSDLSTPIRCMTGEDSPVAELIAYAIKNWENAEPEARRGMVRVLRRGYKVQ